MKPYLINQDDVPWQTGLTQGRFGGERKNLTAHVRARSLDVRLVRLAPGQMYCPYHFHHAEEECFYILEGRGRLRYGSDERPLRPGDVIGCPTGPESAHQIIAGAEALVYLAISTFAPVEVCEYPDSGKLLAVVAGMNGQPDLRAMFRRASAIDDYFDGEPLAASPHVP